MVHYCFWISHVVSFLLTHLLVVVVVVFSLPETTLNKVNAMSFHIDPFDQYVLPMHDARAGG